MPLSQSATESALAHISAYYGVPAKLGGRVILGPAFHEDAGKIGVITDTDDMRLILRVDGHERIYHPTWELEYIVETVAK